MGKKKKMKNTLATETNGVGSKRKVDRTLTNETDPSHLHDVSETSVKKSRSPVRKSSSVFKSSSKSKYSVEQLLGKAEDCIDSFEYDLALKFCERAFDVEPDNVSVLELFGFLHMQLGNIDTAKIHFNKAIDLSPDKGHSMYMYMGQLSTGMEAIQFYKKGIERVQYALDRASQVSDGTETVTDSTVEGSREEALVGSTEGATGGASLPSGASEERRKPDVSPQDLSTAYCAIAEIYLTDCCFEEDAEEQCKLNIDLALQAQPTSIEALQLLASFALCKQDKQLAKEAIEKGLALWLPELRDIHKNTEDDEDIPLADPTRVCSVSYAVRVSYVKTLIELEDYEMAEEILSYSMQEDNEIVEVWYLHGWLNYLKGEEFYSNARYHLTKGCKVASKSDNVDEQIVCHMQELLTELGPASESDLEEGEADDIASDSEDEDERHEENMDE